MDQGTESPLTPAGIAILQEHAERRNRPAPIATVERPTGSPLWPLLWLMPLFMLGNVCFGPLASFDSAYAHQQLGTALAMIGAAGCVGLICVQTSLLSIYVVFSAEPYWRRLAVLLVGAALLVMAGLCGYVIMFRWQQWPIAEEEMQNVFRFVSPLPLIAAVIQLPHWFLRIMLGWQLTRGPAREELGDSGFPRQPLAPFDGLMAAMVFGLVVAGLLLAPERASTYDPPVWLPALVFSVIAAVGSLIIVLPLMVLFTHLKKMRWAWAIALGVPLLLGMFGFAIAAVSMEWEEFAEFALFAAGMSAALFLTMIAGIAGGIRWWRWFGWSILPASSGYRA